ncbi:MAG: DNA helicase RecG, partial [Alphaproteobacteria bacterium HGW-Alphaproteobacteria-12]
MSIEPLENDVSWVKGVGPALRERLAELGILTVEDLLYHLPRRYLDHSRVKRLSELRPGEEATVVGTVRTVAEKRTAGRKHLFTVTISDGSGYLQGVWFNQRYHAGRMKEGSLVSFSGRADFRYNQLQMANPAYDILDVGGGGERIHTGRIIPLHPASAQVPATLLRRLIQQALDAVHVLPDPVPPALLARYRLAGRLEALRQMHFPADAAEWLRARQRLVFEELLVMETGLALMQRSRGEGAQGISHPAPGDLVGGFKEALPFALTGAQERCFAEIANDMVRPHPMNRLLQGEVGSGKTVVAALALLLAVQGGRQGALMAPTEVLAEQHMATLTTLLEPLPQVKVELLTGSTRPAARRAILQRTAEGTADILIGTHALIQEDVVFQELGLVVVDEQHRFGVNQRVGLKRKGQDPDLLVMTATPIPRTLALTLYGDL